MRIKKFFLLTAAISSFFAYNNVSAFQEGEKSVLSLEDFIQEACLRDTVFQSILIDELALRYRKALTIDSGDFIASITSQYNTFLTHDESESVNTVSLSKLFPYTGVTVGADYSSRLGTSSRAVTSELDAYISVPIAEDAFGSSTRILDKVVGSEIEIARYQIIEAYEDYLSSLVQVYLDWYAAYRNVETARNSYDENIKLLENIKERQKNNIALPIDVNKINVQVLAKQESLITLQNQYARHYNAIVEASRYDGDKEIIPDNPRLYDDVEISFDDDYSLFITESRTYAVLSLLERKTLLRVDIDADALLPSLELRLGYLLQGSGHDLDKNTNIAYARAAFDWPFWGQVERAQYETSKISLRKRQLSNQSAYASLYTSLRDIYEAMEREKKLIALAEEKIILAEKIVEDETINYSYGKVTLKDYIDQINQLEESKFNKINHTIQLRKLIVEWLRLTDKLVLEADSL
jgi:hypothetical protein